MNTGKLEQIPPNTGNFCMTKQRPAVFGSYCKRRWTNWGKDKDTAQRAEQKRSGWPVISKAAYLNSENKLYWSGLKSAKGAEQEKVSSGAEKTNNVLLTLTRNQTRRRRTAPLTGFSSLLWRLHPQIGARRGGDQMNEWMNDLVLPHLYLSLPLTFCKVSD